MTDRTSLSLLLEKVEAATGADRKLDAAIGASLKITDTKLWELADGYIYDVKVSQCGLRVEVWSTCGDGRDVLQASCVPEPYTASLDAALALTERLLPGWNVDVRKWNTGTGGADLFSANGVVGHHAHAATPALALLAALLRALISRDEQPGATTTTCEDQA